jgi:serine/threonine protein kinase
MNALSADDANDAVLFDKIKSGRYDDGDPVWEHISDGAKALIAKMLSKDVHRRPSAAQTLQDPWLVEQAAIMAALPEGELPVAAQRPTLSQRQVASVSRLLSIRSAQRSEANPVGGCGENAGSRGGESAVVQIRATTSTGGGGTDGRLQAVPKVSSTMEHTSGSTPADQDGADVAEGQGSDGSASNDEDDGDEFDQASYL